MTNPTHNVGGIRADMPIVVNGVPYIVVDVDTTERGDAIIAVPADAPDDGRDHLEDIDPYADIEMVDCAWFAKCTNTAIAVEPHPVLGPVPICERCRDKIRRLSE